MTHTCASFVIVGTSSSSLSSLDSSFNADIFIIFTYPFEARTYVQNINKSTGFFKRRHATEQRAHNVNVVCMHKLTQRAYTIHLQKVSKENVCRQRSEFFPIISNETIRAESNSNVDEYVKWMLKVPSD